MPSLILVRHGQGSFGGASYDVLSDVGHVQAGDVAAALDDRNLRVEKVLSGSLRRQLNTAEAIAAPMGADVEVDDRWNEYDTGDIFEHHSTSAAREERGPGATAPAVSSREFQVLLEAALLAWIAAGGSGPARETFAAFSTRVLAALASAAADLPAGGTAVVCTSGGVLGVVCMSLLGVAPSSVVAFNRTTINTGLTKIAVGRSGMTLVSFNEHGHLDAAGDPALLTYR
jgi:broad specificity phosphatase PhoE